MGQGVDQRKFLHPVTVAILRPHTIGPFRDDAQSQVFENR